MTTARADQYNIESGADLLAGVSSSAAPPLPPPPPPVSALITLGYDRATPEQISLRCPIIAAIPDDAQLRVAYRIQGGSDWLDAGNLYRIVSADLGALPADLVGRVTNSFVGHIIRLLPGAIYEIRLTLSGSGIAEQIVTGTRATRTLPAAAPAVTKTCTPSTFAAVLSTLAPGDHLRLGAGTYPLSSALTSVPGGTAGQPVYITAAAIGDVTIARASGTALAPSSDYVVWERIRFTGSGADSGLAVTSQFCNPSGLRRNIGWCFRYCEISGFDAAFKCFEPVYDFLVYECLLRGNNTWPETWHVPDEDLGLPLNQQYPRMTWDDSGLQFPGSGNAAWSNTISGFGDTFRCHTSSGVKFTAGNYYWRNRVEWGGDNAFEADDASGNVAAYDNLIMNSGDMLSADVTYGPVGFYGNVCINVTRGPLKLTSTSQFTRVISNTFVITAKTSSHGLLTPSAVGQTGLEYKNNLFVYSGPGNVIHWSSQLTREVWRNNAWTDGPIFILGSDYASVAAARSGNSARFGQDVVVPAQPFASAITMAPDYSTQVTGSPSAALAAVSTARNAGVVVPGITDGFSGAAPDIGAIITGRPVVQFGVPATVGLPLWVPRYSDTVANVEVLTVANGRLANNVSDVQAPYYELYGQRSLFSAYAGGVFNPHWGALGAYFYTGGGHAGNNENTAYCLSIGEQCVWGRLNDPTPIFGAGTDQTTKYNNSFTSFSGLPNINPLTCASPVDGQVLGTHTWGHLVVLPPTESAPKGTLFMPWATVAGRNTGADQTYSFTSYAIPIASESTPSASRKWVAQYTSPTLPYGTAFQNLVAPPTFAVHDTPSNRTLLIHRRNGPVRWYDHTPGFAGDRFVSGTGTALNLIDSSSAGGPPLHVVGVPERRLAVMVYRRAGLSYLSAQVMDMSLAQPAWNNAPANFTAQIQVDADWSCVAWSQLKQRLVIGDVKGNRGILWLVQIPTVLSDPWVCTQVTMSHECTRWRAADARSADNATDFGKWSENPFTRCFVYFNKFPNNNTAVEHTDEVFAIRLPGV